MRHASSPTRRARRRSPFVFSRCRPWLEGLEERTLLSLQAVSLANPALFGSANGPSDVPSISDDGQIVVFDSSAANLVDGATSTTNPAGLSSIPTQVYAGNLTSGSTTLVSQGPTTTGYAYPTNPILSGNGQFVLFYSTNQSLVPGLGLPGPNLFEANLQNGTISLVAGAQTSTPITQVSVSADGRYVAFVSTVGKVTTSPAVSSSSITNVYVRDMVAGTSSLVSVNLARNDGGDGNSSDPTISADGSEIVFQSDADNLVVHDTNAATDVFARNLQTGVTTLVSANLSNADSGDFASFNPVLSGDGNHVVFLSHADDLESIHKHNLFVDVYERDLQTGVTTLISVDTAGTDSILGDSSDPIISADGRYVAFDNEQVVTQPNPGDEQLYVRDTQADTTTLVSVNADGTAGSDQSPLDATMSADGSVIAFVSSADDLVDLPTNGHQNLFVRNLTTGMTTLVSVNAAGTAGGDGDSDASTQVSGPVVMTPDGSHIAFVSAADDLVAGDNNAEVDVFVRDLTTGKTQLVSARAADLPPEYTADGPTFLGALSGNGQYVATNGGDIQGIGDFPGTPAVRDLQTGTVIAPDPAQGYDPYGLPAGAAVLSTDGSVMAFEDASLTPGSSETNVYAADVPGRAPVLVSVNAAGTGPGNASSYAPVLSGDGGTVVFTSAATNLVSGFVQGQGAAFDLYARNLTTGVTSLVSVSAGGTTGGDGSTGADGSNDNTPGADVDNQDTGYDYSVSADGRYVAFASGADDLTSIDTSDNFGGIYVRDLQAGTTQLVDVASDGTSPANGRSSKPVISADGRYVAFFSKATNLVPGLSLTGNEEVYVRDLQTQTTRLVSVDPSGNPLIAALGAASLSANGQIIAVTGVSLGTNEIYAYNMATGVSQVVGVDTAGDLPTYNAAEESYDEVMGDPVVSADGNVVGFISNADNFAPGTTGVAGQLYLRDLQAGTTTLISANRFGTGGGHTLINNGSAGFQGVTNFALSDDASTVAFTSDQYDLVDNEYNITTNVFVVQQASTTPTTGSIGGQVFNDLNGNGTLDSGENGLAGETVYLDLNGDHQLDPGDPTATTNAGGSYSFGGLSPGTYTVGEVVPAGLQQTTHGTQSAIVTAGQTTTGPSFGDQALPPDLKVQTVTVPASIVPGQSASGISYTVVNQGTAAVGDWQDAIYLSTGTTIGASATLLGVEPHTGGLAAGSSYSVSLADVTIPTLTPGTYHVLVQVDRRGQVSEPASEKVDEAGASVQTLSLTIPALTIGIPAADTFGAPGQDHYYQVTVTAGQNLLLSVASQAASGTLSIAERFGDLPVPGSTDETTAGTTGPGQTLAISPTQAGTYFIDVHSEAGAAASAGFTLAATTAALGLRSSSPTAVGNAGSSTIEIDGLGLTQATRYALIGPGGTIAAQSVQFNSGSQALATFDLTGVAAGSYTLQATPAVGMVATLSGALTVKAGIGAQLVTSVSGPANVRVGRIYGFTITYANTGDADAVAPLLQIVAPADTPIGLIPDAADLDNSTLQLMALSPDGPAGVLRPGQQGTITVYFQASPVSPVITVYTITGDDATPMEYGPLSPELQGTDIPDAQWAPIYAAFEQEVGPTTGDYVQMLARNATLAPAGSGEQSDPFVLAEQQINVATAAVSTSISGAVTSSDPSVTLGGLAVTAYDAATNEDFAATTLNDGSFSIPNIDPGTYQISVTGVVAANPPTVTVAASQALTGVVVDVTEGDVIAGQATTAVGGAPVAGATVEAIADDGTPYQTETQPDGLYRLTGLTPGTYTLVVQAAGLAQSEVAGVIVSATPATQNVSLAPGATLTGSFTIEAGGPSGGTPFVVATLSGSTDFNQSYYGTVQGSQYSIPGLPAGTYDVSVSLDGFVSQTVIGVNLAAGLSQTAGNVTLAPAASVTGTVLQAGTTTPAAYDQVFALQGTTVVAATIADANGAFEIDGLPPGTYTFVAGTPTSGISPDVFPTPDASPAGGNASTPMDLKQGVNKIGLPLDDASYDAMLANVRSNIQGKDQYLKGFLLKDTGLIDALTALQQSLPAAAICPRCQGLLKIAKSATNHELMFLDNLIDELNFADKSLNNDLINIYALSSLNILDDYYGGQLALFVHKQFVSGSMYLKAANAISNYQLCEKNCDNPAYPTPTPDPNPNQPAPVNYKPKNGHSNDPNEKTGPGYGPQGFVTAGASMPYQVGFENEPTATATVQEVTVTDPLSSDLDWATFRLGDITFGANVVQVPAGLQSYTTTVTTTNSDGSPLLVDVSAGIDLATGVVSWTLRSVDPTTGELPLGVDDGILPPDNGTGNGTGSVAFTIEPNAGLTTGTSFTNTASVVFDTNAPVATDTVTNTIDAVAPSSSVATLPAASPANFTVTWAGTDPAGGSGVATYNVYVSTDGGAFSAFQLGTTATSAPFNGAQGHTYAFVSVATDNAGNVQSFPAHAQATTLVPVQAPTALTAVAGTGTLGGTLALTATLTQGGAPLAGQAVSFTLDVGGSTTAVGTATTNAAGVATLANLSLTGLNAGTSPGAVGASFAGDLTHAGSTAGGDLAIAPAPTQPVVVVMPKPVPLVTVQSVLWQTVKTGKGKHAKSTRELVVTFSGALEQAPAQNLNDYHLVAAGKDKKFGTRDDIKVKLAAPTYAATANPTAYTVTLIPKGTVPKQTLQLTINAAGTLDAEGRPIDGNRDGQPGGDLHATFQGGGIRLASISQAGFPGRVSAESFDALMATGHLDMAHGDRGIPR